jgi:hypothetical protein
MAVDKLYGFIENNKTYYNLLVDQQSKITGPNDPNLSALIKEQLDFVNRMSNEITTALGVTPTGKFINDSNNPKTYAGYVDHNDTYVINLPKVFSSSDLKVLISTIFHEIIHGKVQFGIKRGDFDAIWVTTLDRAIMEYYDRYPMPNTTERGIFLYIH